MKVMKFGGTSIGKPQRMHGVAQLITSDPEPKIVVLSAVSGTTNALLDIAALLAKGDRIGAKERIDSLEQQYNFFVQELLTGSKELQQAEGVLAEHFEFLNIILKISYSEALSKDIIAQGELLSTKLFSIYLQQEKIDHILLAALEFMHLDSNDEPQIGSIRVKLMQHLQQFPDQNIFLTQGFVCRNVRGEVDNLKRGGSDYSASLIAAAANASVCEIWTDISGMHNNDPRVVDKTIPIEQLSFDEAAELAYFGAKILHPASIWPAQQHQIPVKLLNTLEPDAKGTLISQQSTSKGVKAIAAKDGITAINIKSSRMLLAYGFLRKVFEVFEKYKTPIDMITTSEVAVSVTIDTSTALKKIIKELETLGAVTVDQHQTIICIVGNEISGDGSTLKKIFDSLPSTDIRMVSYGGSAHNISILVPATQKKEVLQQLNSGLFGL
jgi:aspartate kinase